MPADSVIVPASPTIEELRPKVVVVLSMPPGARTATYPQILATVKHRENADHILRAIAFMAFQQLHGLRPVDPRLLRAVSDAVLPKSDRTPT